jgi:hypothetical protein
MTAVKRPETGGADLLDIAEATLVTAVLPTLTGEARFAALMVASAMRMVAREGRLPVPDGPAPDPRALVAAIRAGRHDTDRELHAALLNDAARRTFLSRPDTLSGEDRRAAGLDPA